MTNPPGVLDMDGAPEMVERVQLAIFKSNMHPDDALNDRLVAMAQANWPQEWDRAGIAARAAIEAMREPTVAMVSVAPTALDEWRRGLDADEKMLRHTIKDGRGYTEATVPEKHTIRWRAMIDAALNHPA